MTNERDPDGIILDDLDHAARIAPMSERLSKRGWFSPAEMAITVAQYMVEHAGASDALTEASVLLGKALLLVANHVEGRGDSRGTEETEAAHFRLRAEKAEQTVLNLHACLIGAVCDRVDMPGIEPTYRLSFIPLEFEALLEAMGIVRKSDQTLSGAFFEEQRAGDGAART